MSFIEGVGDCVGAIYALVEVLFPWMENGVLLPISFESQENQFEGCLLCVSCKLKPSSTAALFTNLADEKESVKREILVSTLKAFNCVHIYISR
jgi:hypothetical protein